MSSNEIAILHRGTIGDAKAIGAHAKRVQHVAQFGGTTPKAYTEALAKWHAWSAEQTSPLEALADAYRDGADETTLATLRAAALLAEITTPEAEGRVHRSVAPVARQQLHDAYHTVASRNYNKIRDQFNATANDFIAHTAIVDPESDAKTLVSASDEVRTAWLNAEVLAGKLDALTDALADAAILAGTKINNQPDKFGLVVNAEGVHRREAWTAWNTSNNRCGRWSALHQLGCELRAAELGEHKPYREAHPLEKRHVRGRFGVRTVTIDPESGDADEQVQLNADEKLITLI